MIARFDNQNYLNKEIGFIVSKRIAEYDIRKANISILRYYNLITEEQYHYYYNLPKYFRERNIGCLQRDNKEINDALNKGFIAVNNEFLKINHIEQENVLSVKKDSIFVLDVIPQYLELSNQYGSIKYINKNIYNSYFNIFNVEYYYKYDPISNEEVIDIKGISDEKLEWHREGFITILCEIFYTLQTSNVQDVVSLIKSIYLDYVNLKYPIEYYRSFDSSSCYIIKNTNYGVLWKNGLDKTLIDISYNTNILRELFHIISGIALNNI